MVPVQQRRSKGRYRWWNCMIFLSKDLATEIHNWGPETIIGIGQMVGGSFSSLEDFFSQPSKILPFSKADGSTTITLGCLAPTSTSNKMPFTAAGEGHSEAQQNQSLKLLIVHLAQWVIKTYIFGENWGIGYLAFILSSQIGIGMNFCKETWFAPCPSDWLLNIFFPLTIRHLSHRMVE